MSALFTLYRTELAEKCNFLRRWHPLALPRPIQNHGTYKIRSVSSENHNMNRLIRNPTGGAESASVMPS